MIGALGSVGHARRRTAVVLGVAMTALAGLGIGAALVLRDRIADFAVTHCTPRTVRDIDIIGWALDEYESANRGRYPDHLEELVTPDANGRTFLDGTRVPRDPWGREYRYEPPGEAHAEPRVYSLGRDGRPGGRGEDEDIDSLEIRFKERSP